MQAAYFIGPLSSALAIHKREAAEGPYIAELKDSSLYTLLNEAFAVIEHRFAVCDRDKAGMLMYRALEANLALAGFVDDVALQQIWSMVDLDRNGTLDFGEFLCLIFLWKTVGDYSSFFLRVQNAKVVTKAFAQMKRIFHKHDGSHKRRLKPEELSSLIQTHLPELKQGAQTVVDRL